MMKNFRKQIRITFPLLVTGAGYVVFFLGVAANRLNPSFETGLGLAYYSFFGLPFVTLGLILAFTLYRSKSERKYLFIVLTAFLGYLIIVISADKGNLSVF